MKIGLVGPPGSGKTRLAQALANALDTDDRTVGVIDEYAEGYSTTSDFAIGEDATYIVNLGIALSRLQSERRMGDDFIVCGTMADTATYMACEATLFPDEPGWQRRHLASLALAGCMVNDLVTYDFTFYLPLPEHTQTFGIGFDEEVRSNLPVSLRLFDIPHITLDRPSFEENLAHALNVIHESAPPAE